MKNKKQIITLKQFDTALEKDLELKELKKELVHHIRRSPFHKRQLNTLIEKIYKRKKQIADSLEINIVTIGYIG